MKTAIHLVNHCLSSIVCHKKFVGLVFHSCLHLEQNICKISAEYRKLNKIFGLKNELHYHAAVVLMEKPENLFKQAENAFTCENI